MIPRRSFLFAIPGLLLPFSKLRAYPLDRILGEPPKDFVQQYIRRYWLWYQQQWGSFANQMEGPEKKLFGHWQKNVNHFGQKLDNKHYIENFLTRHTLIDNERFHSHFYAGLPSWSDEGTQLLQDFFSHQVPGHRMTRWQIESVFGWSHDFDENKIRLWLKKPKQGVFFEANQIEDPLLGFIEFHHGNEIRRGIITSPADSIKSLPSEIDRRLVTNAFLIKDSLGNNHWKFRTKGTYLPNLKKGISWIAAKHQSEFKQIADFIDTKGSKQLKVYYP